LIKTLLVVTDIFDELSKDSETGSKLISCLNVDDIFPGEGFEVVTVVATVVAPVAAGLRRKWTIIRAFHTDKTQHE